MSLLHSRRRSAILQTTIQHELHGAIQCRNNPLEKFVPRESLVAIWTTERLVEFIRHMRTGLDRTFIPLIQREFLQTISILVYMDWDDWARFYEIFVSHVDMHGERDRTDRNIPTYSLQMLESTGFLGRVSGARFLDLQYIFCPIDIKVGASLTYSREWRLPFLEGESKPLGRGGYGLVTQESIPGSHYILENGSFATNKVRVARKVFASRGDFHHETNALNLIRDGLSHHDRIALHLATVAVGNDFHLLSPLATMDLEDFLSGNCLQPDLYEMSELIQEATYLADALDHLHERLQSPFPVYFCHRDLKPSNILVYMEPEGPNWPRVGKWKIADFGLSVVARQRRPVPVPDFVTQTVSHEPRVQGAYQAPEVSLHLESGRRSDVWSFGCILVRLFAFKLDGILGLKELDELRGKASDGISNFENDYFIRGDPVALNPHIEEWIRRLPDRDDSYNTDFLFRCRDLLLSTLEVERNRRPFARHVRRKLQELNDSVSLRPDFPLVQPVISVESATPSTMGRPSIGLISDSGTSSMSDPSSTHRISDVTTPSITSLPEHLAREIRHGNIDGIKTILNGNVNVDGLADGDRPLIHAIRHNFPDAVEHLLAYRYGIDFETPDSEGSTPLRLAVHLGHSLIASLLLTAGAYVNATSKSGITPLMTAARRGDVNMVRTLLERGADCMAYSDEGFTCLHYATYSENGANVIRMLRQFFPTVDVPREGSNREMPLLTLVKMYADNPAWWEKFKALLEGGANVNIGDTQGHTPMSLAIRGEHARLVKRLLDLNVSTEGITIRRHQRSDMAHALRGVPRQAAQESPSWLLGYFRRRS